MGDCLTSLTVMANKQSCQPFCNPTTHTHTRSTHPAPYLEHHLPQATGPVTTYLTRSICVRAYARVCLCRRIDRKCVFSVCVQECARTIFNTLCTVGQDCVLVQFQRTTLYILSHPFLLYDVTNWTSHVHPYVTHLS